MVNTLKTVSHTLGPWNIDTALETLIRGADGTALASVGVINMHERREEGQANTRLIAAAPDMLAALKAAHALLDIATVGEKLECQQSEVLIDLKLAITKAERGA